jgi:hypothetical protein
MPTSTIDQSMSLEVRQLLKSFSNAANKSTGGTHPSDERRFLDFIVKAHEENASLNESQLNEWFVSEGWTEDHAFELSCNYRFGRALLTR